MEKSIEAIVDKLTVDSGRYWPENPPKRIEIDKKISRPYSSVYRLRLDRESTSYDQSLHGGAFVKIFKPSRRNTNNHEKYRRRLKIEFDATNRLQSSFMGYEDLSVVRPVEYFSEHLALVTDEAEGNPLADLIGQTCKIWHGGGQLSQVLLQCRRAGEALAVMQRATRQSEGLDPSALIDYIDIRLKRLEQSPDVPFDSERRQRILRFLKQAAGRVAESQLETCGNHCDYGPFNILSGTEGITVIDFTMYKIDSMYNDVTYFIQRLDSFLHKPIFRQTTIRRAQKSFLEGYNWAHQRIDRPIERDLFFQVYRLKHIVNNYSSLMRNRVGGEASLSAIVRTFHYHIYRRYNKALDQICGLTD